MSDQTQDAATRVHGPQADYDALVASLPEGHPYLFREDENLFWYDGPVCSIGRVPGDERPRIDVMVDSTHEGGDEDRVFTEVRHQLVFEDEATLRATLHQAMAPTDLSYERAVEIHRYVSRCTRTNHPRPSHRIETARVAIDQIRDDMPGPGLAPGDDRAGGGTARGGEE